MTPYFPAVVEGELLYAVLARHRSHVSPPTTAAHMRDLFGRRSAVASFDLQGSLDDLVCNVRISGLDGATLARKHTLLPYYAAFQQEEAMIEGELALRHGDAAAARHRLGVTAWTIRPVSRPRVCPECLADHRATLAGGTLLVAHQLPGSLLCHRHAAPLVVCQSPVGLEGRHAFLLPCLGDAITPHDLMATSGRIRDLLVEISKRQAALVSSSGAARRAASRCDLLGRLDGLGLMRSARKVDQERLSVEIGRFFEGVLRLLPEPARRVGTGGWPETMVRNPRKSMHPLLHVLMATFLDRSEASGSISGRTPRPADGFGPGPWPCLNPLADHKSELRIATVDAYRNRGAVVGRFSCDCGYVYSRGLSSAGELGPPKFRAGGPLLEVALRRLISSGAKLRAMARELGLDPKTVVREALSIGLDVPWATKASGRVRQKAPVQPRSEPKRRAQRGAAVPSVDWPALDLEMVVRLRHAATSILAMRPPRRVTFSFLEKRVARVGWLAKRSRKLPRSHAYASSVVESTTDFQRRRVRAVLADHEGAEPWVVMRLSGLRSLGLVMDELVQARAPSDRKRAA